MSETETAVIQYLESGGATDEEVQGFTTFCRQIVEGIDLKKDPRHGIKRRYEVYRLWARLLHHRRSKLPHSSKFDFDGILKRYLRELTGGEVVDDPPPPDSLKITKKQFVDYVVRYLDDCF